MSKPAFSRGCGEIQLGFVLKCSMQADRWDCFANRPNQCCGDCCAVNVSLIATQKKLICAMQPTFDPNDLNDDPLSSDWFASPSSPSSGLSSAFTSAPAPQLLPPLLKPPVMPSNEDEMFLKGLERRMEALTRKKPSVACPVPLNIDKAHYPDENKLYQTKFEAETEPLLIETETASILDIPSLDPAQHPRYASLAPQPSSSKTMMNEEEESGEEDAEEANYGALEG